MKIIGSKQRRLYPNKAEVPDFSARKSNYLGKQLESPSLFLSIKPVPKKNNGPVIEH